MEGHDLLTKGLNNWKLRLILSALLCIMGLAALISMILGYFLNLSVYDQSIVAIAIWMVGIPTYLIISGLPQITPEFIALFINEHVDELDLNMELLLKDPDKLEEEERIHQKALIDKFTTTPLYRFLPDKPIKQAFYMMLFSIVCCFGIWYIG